MRGGAGEDGDTGGYRCFQLPTNSQQFPPLSGHAPCCEADGVLNKEAWSRLFSPVNLSLSPCSFFMQRGNFRSVDVDKTRPEISAEPAAPCSASLCLTGSSYKTSQSWETCWVTDLGIRDNGLIYRFPKSPTCPEFTEDKTETFVFVSS